MAQVPNLCWERPLDTTLRLVLLVGMMPHCRKRNGVKTCAGSVTSIDTAQRQRHRSLLGAILRCWQVRLLSCYLFVRITMILPIHPKIRRHLQPLRDRQLAINLPSLVTLKRKRSVPRICTNVLNHAHKCAGKLPLNML